MMRVEDILHDIHRYISGKTDFDKAPLAIYIAAVDQSGCEGDPCVQRYIATDPDSRYRLKVWEKEQRIQLAERIHKLYCEAYHLHYDFDKALASGVEDLLSRKIENNDSGLIRSFIKWYVGFLDLKYGPPEGKAV